MLLQKAFSRKPINNQARRMLSPIMHQHPGNQYQLQFDSMQISSSGYPYSIPQPPMYAVSGALHGNIVPSAGLTTEACANKSIMRAIRVQR